MRRGEGNIPTRGGRIAPLRAARASVYIAPSLERANRFARDHRRWALSSAVEHYLDMVGVRGSIPLAPTISDLPLRLIFAPVFGHSREMARRFHTPRPSTDRKHCHCGRLRSPRRNDRKPAWRFSSFSSACCSPLPALPRPGRSARRRERKTRGLGDPLRDAARSRARAMRDRPQRRRPGSAEFDSGRDRAQHRRPQDAAHASDRAARGAASSGVSLRIDNAEAGRLSFLQCLPNGCVAQLAMDESPARQAEERKDGDPWASSRRPRRASACRRRLPASRKPTNNCLEAARGVSTPDLQTNPNRAIVEVSRNDGSRNAGSHRASFDRARRSRRLQHGRLGRQLGRRLFLSSGSERRRLNAGGEPAAGGRYSSQRNPSDKPKVLPVASQDINCPEVDYRRRRRVAARRRPGQRLRALSVQYRRHGAPMRSRRARGRPPSRLAWRATS